MTPVKSIFGCTIVYSYLLVGLRFKYGWCAW